MSPGALLVLGISGEIVGLLALVGLFVFWRPARVLFLAQSALVLAVTPLLLKTTVDSAWATALYGLSDVSGGVVIALVFFSPLARRFEGRPREKEPSAGEYRSA